MMHRSTAIFLEIVFTALLVVAIGVALLGYRLAQGPLPLPILTTQLERAMATSDVRLRVGATFLEWDSVFEPPSLRVTDVALTDPDGDRILDFAAMSVWLSPADLIRGQLAPSRLRLQGPELVLTRFADGGVAVDLGDRRLGRVGAGGAPADNAGLVTRFLTALEAGPEDRRDGTASAMAALDEVSLTDGRVTILDDATGRVVRISDADIRLARGEAEGVIATELSGRAEGLGLDLGLVARGGITIADGAVDGIQLAVVGRLPVEGRVAEVEARLDFDPRGIWRHPLSDLSLQVREVVPADFAALDPLFEQLAPVDAVLSGRVDLTLDATGRPLAAALDLSSGPGAIVLPAYYAQPPSFARMALDAVVHLHTRRAEIRRARLDLGGPTLTVAGSLRDRPDAVSVDLTVTGDRLPVDLARVYWPAGQMVVTRNWVRGRLFDGVFTGETRVAAQVSKVGDSPQVTALRGDFQFENLSVQFLNGVPRMTDLAGTGRIFRDRLEMTGRTGRLDGLVMQGGSLRIAGLDRSGPKPMTIEVWGHGDLSDGFRVLDAPRFGYITQVGLDPERASGPGAMRFRADILLQDEITTEDVRFSGTVALQDVTIGEVLDDIWLSGVTGQLELTGQGLTMTGTGIANGVPAELAWRQIFGRQGPFRARIDARGRFDQADARALTLPDLAFLSGEAEVEATYFDRSAEDRTIQVVADVTDTGIEVYPLLYEKPPGAPGRLLFTAVIDGDRVARLDDLVLTADDLTADADLVLNPDGSLRSARVNRVIQGHNDLSAELQTGPDGRYVVTATGQRYDAAPFYDQLGASATAVVPDLAAPPDDPFADMTLRVTLDRVRLADDRELQAVEGRAIRAGGDWVDITGAGRSGPDERHRVRFQYQPDADGGRDVQIEASNAGSFLDVLEIFSNVEGGRVLVTGKRPDPSGAILGTAVMSDFEITEAPAVARLLAAVSLTGLGEILGNDGLNFDRLQTEFEYTPSKLMLSGGRTRGGALGLTFDGEIGLAEDGDIAMAGTIIPVADINEFIGAIPILGDLLTGGDSGVFAFNYRMFGPRTDPSVSVNPLSVLAPSFLRRLFLFDAPVTSGDSVLGNADRPGATDAEDRRAIPRPLPPAGATSAVDGGAREVK